MEREREREKAYTNTVAYHIVPYQECSDSKIEQVYEISQNNTQIVSVGAKIPVWCMEKTDVSWVFCERQVYFDRKTHINIQQVNIDKSARFAMNMK